MIKRQRAGCVFICITLLIQGRCQGQAPNSWTNNTSGYWEDPRWSLGLLPGTNETIWLTNGAWKTLTIGPSTSSGYAESMSVAALTIDSSPNLFRQLIVSNAGFQTPLLIGSMSVGTNSAVVAWGSILQADSLTLAGRFNQDAGAQVIARAMRLGDNGSGIYQLNAGTFNSESIVLSGDYSPRFTQKGGTNLSRSLYLYGNSTYQLDSGELDTPIFVHEGAVFNQKGGVARFNDPQGGIITVDGVYLLSGGMFFGPANLGPWGGATLAIPYEWSATNALFEQTGGTNVQFALRLGKPLGPAVNAGMANPSGSGNYVLSNGTLVTSGTKVICNGTIRQSGGSHMVNGPLLLQGTLFYFNNVINGYGWASYVLNQGSLSSQAMEIQAAASMNQSGGTNVVSGTLSLNSIDSFSGSYALSDGVLIVSNLNVGAGPGFTQTGGQLLVSNLTVSTGMVHALGGTLRQKGVLQLSSSDWFVGTIESTLGELELDAGPRTNTTVHLPVGGCLVRFADSSRRSWQREASLTFEGWSGSPVGGGRQQVYFGTGPDGLTSVQLGQVLFHNPAHLSGYFNARMISTGELVPVIAPALSFSRVRYGLQLNWPLGMVLQSAASAAGPFSDVNSATSPYTVSLELPQEFFRLRYAN